MDRPESHFREPLDAAARHAAAWLAGLDRQPIGARADATALRSRLDRPLAAGGVPARQVVDELARDVEGGLHVTGCGRFFAWVIGGALPSALAADWLTSAWDQNAHNFATGPAAAIVEETVGKWLLEIFDLPRRSSFALVTGCQTAHTTCLSAARHAVLARRGWDVEKRGLSGAPPIRILSSDLAHGTIDRALRFLGLGTERWTRIAAGADGRLAPRDLAAALAKESDAPTIVVLQAGEVNAGAFDDFEALVPLAHERGAWVHVDGAFGLWVAASPAHRGLLKGVAAADSWATDGHKWLNVPYDCGYAFVADEAAHSGAQAYRAPYISYAAGVRDQSDWNPEWSRRARGFASYAALRELGRDGVRDLVVRCCDHARAIVEGIGRLPGAEVVAVSQINQGLVRFLDRKAGATDADHDRRTDAVLAAINAAGEAYFSGTTWRGRRAMRVSVCSWRTNAEDVARTVASVASILR